MTQDRRGFLKTLGFAGAVAAGLKPKEAIANPQNTLSDERMGVLVDTTVCIGCRKCEWACRLAHDIPSPNIQEYDDRSVFERMRRPNISALTVVNEYANPENPTEPIDVKVNCMHCDHPACVSACIVGAFSKQENGAVVWDGNKCIGCRYCMVACPFQIPAFEFNTAFQPNILKCDFCYNRTREAKIPACVEVCPVEAMTYGKRYDILELAHKRIRREPDRYIDHVFGEHEAGGTSWVYLASRDFEDLDFPKVGDKPMPGTSESIQHAIFAYFVPPFALYALLGGIMWLSKNNIDSKEER